MAQQHTTPQRSLAAAYAAEQRAQAGSESRLRKDTCYGLYEASLKCECPILPAWAAAPRAAEAQTPVTATGWRHHQLPFGCLAGLDQNDYNRDACEEAFDAFKACRSNQKASKAGVRADRWQSQAGGGDQGHRVHWMRVRRLLIVVCPPLRMLLTL